jgi:hypothetical protein
LKEYEDYFYRTTGVKIPKDQLFGLALGFSMGGAACTTTFYRDYQNKNDHSSKPVMIAKRKGVDLSISAHELVHVSEAFIRAYYPEFHQASEKKIDFMTTTIPISFFGGVISITILYPIGELTNLGQEIPLTEVSLTLLFFFFSLLITSLIWEYYSDGEEIARSKTGEMQDRIKDIFVSSNKLQ